MEVRDLLKMQSILERKIHKDVKMTMWVEDLRNKMRFTIKITTNKMTLSKMSIFITETMMTTYTKDQQ